MSDVKRKMIEQEFYVTEYDLQGRVVEVIDTLQYFVNQFGDSAEIEIQIHYHGYDGADIECFGRYVRQETDKELDKRLTRAKKARATAKANRVKAKAEKEEQERKMLADLLEKYGEE